MARKSDIEKYPNELLAYVHQCLDDPKLNLDEQLEKINAVILETYLNENEATRSSLGRYAKKRRERFERQIQIMAQQKAYRDEYYERFEGTDLDLAGRFNVEMMMPVMTKIIGVLHLIADDTTPEQANLHAKTIKLLTSASGDLEKTLSESKSRNDAIKKEAREEERQKGAERVAEIAKARGQTPEQVEFWRKDFLAGRR